MSCGTLSDDLTAFESSWSLTALRRLEKAAVWVEDTASLADELTETLHAAALAVHVPITPSRTHGAREFKERRWKAN